MSSTIIMMDSSPTVKWITAVVPTPTSTTKYIQLGLTPKKVSGIANVVNSLIHRHDGGKTSSLTLRAAEEMASALSARFDGMEVKVITQSIIGSHRDLYFDTDPATGEKVLKPGIDREDVYEPVALQFDDLDHAREVLAFCDEHLHIVSTADRAALIAHVAAMEEQLRDSRLLTTTITPAQREALLAIADPYIDAIIAKCDEVASAAELVGSASTWLNADVAFASTSKRELALAVLMESLQRDSSTVYYEQVPGLATDCKDSGAELRSLYRGDPDHSIESTLRRLASGSIPNIVIRRMALMEKIDEKLTTKFGPETEAPMTEGLSHALITRIRARLFAEGCPLGAIGFGSHELQTLSINTTRRTIEILQTGFTEEYTWWVKHDDEFLTPAEANARLAIIRAEVEASLAPASAVAGAGVAPAMN